MARTSALSCFISTPIRDFKAYLPNLKSIGNFINVKKIESRLRNIVSTSKFENLDEQQKLAVTILLDTIDGKIKDPYKDIDDDT